MPDYQDLLAWTLFQQSIDILSKHDIWLIWQLQLGLLQNQVAVLFQVSPSTISKLKVKFHIMGGVRDSP